MDDAAPVDRVAAQINGDDDAGAERPANRDRHRIDQRAVNQPAAVDLDRTEDAGKRERRLERIHQAAFIEPDFMAGAELGGDRYEFPFQPLDGDVLQMVL